MMHHFVPHRIAARARYGVACLLFAFCLAAPTHALEQAEASEDVEIRDRIEAQLAGFPDGTGADMRVMVRDGEVLLQGRARLLEQSLRAEQAAWKTPGVRDVDNELRVVPDGVVGDAAIERQVRMIIKLDGRFIDTSLEIKVLAGVVRVRGMFQDPADVLALKHRIGNHSRGRGNRD